MLTNGDMTLYHKIYNEKARLDEWRREYIRNIHWYAKRAVTITDKGLVSADTLIVRVPVSSVKGELKASPGDYVIRGIIDKDITRESELEGFNKYLITAIRDNRSCLPDIQHWKIEGQ